MWTLTKRMAQEGEQRLSFTIPIFEPLPSQYIVRAVSEDWIGAEAVHAISFSNLILPERGPPNTGESIRRGGEPEYGPPLISWGSECGAESGFGSGVRTHGSGI